MLHHTAIQNLWRWGRVVEEATRHSGVHNRHSVLMRLNRHRPMSMVLSQPWICLTWAGRPSAITDHEVFCHQVGVCCRGPVSVNGGFAQQNAGWEVHRLWRLDVLRCLLPAHLNPVESDASSYVWRRPTGWKQRHHFNSCLGMFGEIVGARLLACWSFCWF